VREKKKKKSLTHDYTEDADEGANLEENLNEITGGRGAGFNGFWANNEETILETGPETRLKAVYYVRGPQMRNGAGRGEAGPTTD